MQSSGGRLLNAGSTALTPQINESPLSAFNIRLRAAFLFGDEERGDLNNEMQSSGGRLRNAGLTALTPQFNESPRSAFNIRLRAAFLFGDEGRGRFEQ
jgi:hypothetical protein